MKNTALIWDFDNTIAKRNGMWGATLHELLAKNGINNISREMIKSYLASGFPWHLYEKAHSEIFHGKTWWEYIENKFYLMLTELNLKSDIAKTISSQIKEKYIDLEYWQLYDGVEDILSKLISIGYRNYILSNHVPELEDIVKGLNIHKYFDGIFTSGNIGFEKPNYRIFKYCIDYIEKYDNYIMIGDNYIADIVGARSFGINGILVRSNNEYNYKYYSKNLFNIENIIEEIINI